MDTAHRPTLDSEQAFLGCVLALPAAPARRVMAGMRADDFADPLAGLVAQLVIEVLAAGCPAAPAAVLARAEHTGRVPALHDLATGQRGQGEDRYTRLTHYLIDAYRADAWPGLGDYLKPAVLEHAWRRAIAEHATRLAQAAAQSPADVLADLADDTTRIEELRARYRAALDTRHLEVAA